MDEEQIMTPKLAKEEMQHAGARLVNEAIKRILLDIVIRGHGDRLIGRWSREPELQQFLEQVPYMLDRINQLHLACSRSSSEQNRKTHHHYHHHHLDTLLSSSQSSLSDFINLIGPDRHWLVRTRDPLGLTPLHKAVLFDNRPIVEYILDRYPDELAASGGVQQQQQLLQSKRSAYNLQHHGATRLINAQDKYGRCALHYAAALLAQGSQSSLNEDEQPSRSEGKSTHRQLYHFLVAKGASLMAQDFRGKTPAHYVRHPNQLRVKSIIHLANKLHANYQANVLSKTLRANNERGPIDEREFHDEQLGKDVWRSATDDWPIQVDEAAAGIQQLVSCNRESMSLSCNDLVNFPTARDIETDNIESPSSNQEDLRRADKEHSKSALMSSGGSHTNALDTGSQSSNTGASVGQDGPAQASQMKQASDKNRSENQPITSGSSSSSSPANGKRYSVDGTQVCSPESSETDSQKLSSDGIHTDPNLVVALKELIRDRCPDGMVIDQRTKQVIRRSLNDGVIDRINELLADGYGNYLISEASTSCWNQQCKRYINQVIPSLQAKLDTLHELIASNQLLALKSLLNQDPILARIRRPYKRAAMSALHVAVWRDRRTIVKYLVGRFPELVGQRDSHGATCLHWAAKCLRQDRLYSWLLEHFGHQLEQVRDWRGKSALDYRQQAFRLSNFAESHPQPNSGRHKRSMEASDILSDTRKASDQLLFRGSKVSMKNRAKPVQLATTQTTIRTTSGTDELMQSPPPMTKERSGGRYSAAASDLDKSIELPIDSAGETPLMREGDEMIEPSTASTGSNMISNASNCRKADSRGIRRQPVNGNGGTGKISSPGAAAHVTFFKEEGRSIPIQSEATHQSGSATRVVTDSPRELSLNCDNLNQELLGEMVQMDSNELQSRADTTGSPPATTSLPVSRPQSASFPSTLEVMIISCLRSDDFKKLEHLILAGCGKKLLEVYNSKGLKASAQPANSSKSKQVALVSSRMIEFCEKRAPPYINKIVKIHKLLHQCFSEQLVEGSKSSTGDTFHKLCNLLDRRRLIICRDDYGASPLHVAFLRSDQRLIDYLLRRHPEAASAPDYDSRNCFHYASLALAVYEAHGSFRLTTLPSRRVDSKANEDDEKVTGCWLVDENIRTMHASLATRYAELLEIRDRMGFTGVDYASGTTTRQQIEHVSLDQQADEYLPAGLLADCCPVYAQLLARYEYVIFRGTKLVSSDAAGGEKDHDIRDQSSHRLDETEPELPREEQTPYQMDSLESVSLNHLDQAELANLEMDNQAAGLAESRMADSDLVRQLDGELLVPIAFAPLESAVVRQVAPKPTVGSESGYPGFGSQSPAYLIGEPSFHDDPIGKQLSASPQSKERRHHSSRRNKGSLLDDLDPNQRGHRSSYQHHRRHHHRHNRHHHHKRKGTSMAVQSIVGGVIVPTIIHNDKMDEIETYDIIYRRPPPISKKQVSAGSASTSSFSSSSSSCSLSSASDDGGADPEGAQSSSRLAVQPAQASDSGKASPASGSHIGGANHSGNPMLGLSASTMPSSGSSSSTGSLNGDEPGRDAKDDEDDDRVERLSNEFENRVRKEKSELRAKVDQIMNEIKLSAKSGKSSRFLASPSDFAVSSETKPGGSNDNSVFLFSTTNEPSKTLSKTVHKQVGNGKRHSVESHSSGHCSERTCDTSATSSASSSSSSRSSKHGATGSCSSGSTSVSSKNTSTSGSHSFIGSSTSVIRNISKLTGESLTKKASQNGKEFEVTGVSQLGVHQRPSSSGQSNQNESGRHITSSISELTGQLVSKNTYGQTYLHFIASKSQSASTLYKVLDHGSHLIGERDIFYRTARDVASQFHLANNVQVLDKYIIDLFIGANTSLLRHLLNQGYSPLIHVSDTDGNDIMLILKLLKLDRMIHFLLQMADFQRWRDELHTFIRNGYSAGLTELIKKHVDLVRAKSVHARTALHLAVLFDRPDMAIELIERDPTCVHCTDNMGRTALHYTYGLNLKNVEEIRELLLENGASLEARDVKMRTPKYYFIFKREIEEIKRIELELN